MGAGARSIRPVAAPKWGAGTKVVGAPPAPHADRIDFDGGLLLCVDAPRAMGEDDGGGLRTPANQPAATNLAPASNLLTLRLIGRDEEGRNGRKEKLGLLGFHSAIGALFSDRDWSGIAGEGFGDSI